MMLRQITRNPWQWRAAVLVLVLAAALGAAIHYGLPPGSYSAPAHGEHLVYEPGLLDIGDMWWLARVMLGAAFLSLWVGLWEHYDNA